MLSWQLTKSSLTSTAAQFSTTTRKINRALVRCEEASNKALIRAIFFFHGCGWPIFEVGWVNTLEQGVPNYIPNRLPSVHLMVLAKTTLIQGTGPH